VKWILPPSPNYKLNIDGSYDPLTHNGGIGGVIRNHEGQWILGYSKPLHHTTVLQAELLALLHGLQLAIAHRLLPLTVESDSQVLMTLLPYGNPKYSHLFHVCRLMLHDLHVPQINHIYREGNTVADALTHFGKKLCLSQHTDVLLFDNPPP
ncbi:hypothetical protein A4A49_62754, partial [Nicotiana attenuata]